MGITNFTEFASMMAGGTKFADETQAAMQNSTITGSCLCSAVKYQLVGCPFNRVLCHCDNCKRVTGSAFMANSLFKRSQFTITHGKDALTSYHDSKNESGGVVERWFCSTCGSPVFAHAKGSQGPDDFISVTTGTMDVDHQSFEEAWRPDQEFYCVARKRWVPPVEGAIRHDKR